MSEAIKQPETVDRTEQAPFAGPIGSQITDTQRLDFLLQFFRVDDVGDEEYVLGVVVDHEAAEEQITYGPMGTNGRMESNIRDWKDDMRTVLDRAIMAHSANDQDHRPLPDSAVTTQK